MMNGECVELTVATICRNIVKNGRSNSMRNCIESVRRQAYSNMEHLVVDGASTDGTLDLLHDYEEDGLRVVSEPDRGIYDAMNKALRMARGKYLVFLNSDDAFSDVGSAEAIMEQIVREDGDFLFANADVYSADHSRFLSTWKGTIDEMPFGYYPCHQTLVCKTKVLRDMGGFTENYMANDNLLMLKLVVRGYRPVYLDRTVVDFHVGGASGAMIADKDRMKREHVSFFMEEFGRKVGLTEKDCERLYAKNYLSLPIHEQFELGSRLVMPCWIRRYHEILAGINRAGVFPPCRQIRVRIFGKIPFFGVDIPH